MCKLWAMVVGRPRQFEREEALGKAMETFWAKGYDATSVQDLLNAMGINRGSMYDTFGDKHALFEAAFDHYVTGLSKRWKTVLKAPGSPLGNVRTMLNEVATLASDGHQWGCMVTNCAVELSPRDPMVAKTLKGVFRQIGNLVRETLDRAVKADELPPRTNTRAQTRFVIATIQGLMVLGKSAHSRRELQDVVDIAVSALK